MAEGYLTPWRRSSPSGPFGGSGTSLFDLNRQVNRLFEDMFDRSPMQHLGAGSGWPQLEIEQNDDRIQITAELPGVKEPDISLDIEDGMLTLSGEKRSERKDESGYSERSYGRFERRISLPSNIDEEKCTAEFRDGLLTVTIPRSAAKARGRRIPLGAGSGSNTEAKTVARGTPGAQNDRESHPMQEAAQEPAGQSQHEDWKPEDQQG